VTIEYFQKGFNYGQDGPGNRLVYHLAGCNMRCPWCSNPEGMAAGRAGNRRETVEEIAEAVLSARPMFFDGGGLTLTGGEATLQLDAVKELLTLVRAAGVDTAGVHVAGVQTMGIRAAGVHTADIHTTDVQTAGVHEAGVRAADVHTAIETNMTSPRLPELMPLLNLLIADFKHPDSEAHLRFTGVSNEQALINLAYAAASEVDLLIRIPLIHGVNDDDATLSGFLEALAPFAGRARVEVLSYHEYGKDKWKTLGLSYRMEDAFLPKGRAETLEKMLKDAGLDTVRT
jgi:pyruvate formate lyase activating enzyme